MAKLTMTAPRGAPPDNQQDFERQLDRVLTSLRAGQIRLRLLDVHYEVVERAEGEPHP